MNFKIVFPAPAGVILPFDVVPVLSRCFPRTCGGDPSVELAAYAYKQFSPHLRG